MQSSSPHQIQERHFLISTHVGLNPKIDDLNIWQLGLNFSQQPFAQLPRATRDHVLASCISGMKLEVHNQHSALPSWT